jgi:hypothetical protein
MRALDLVGTLAQRGGGGGADAGSMLFLVIVLALVVLIIASLWKVFTKAGQPGWAAIIPIYNVYIMCKIGGRPGWWVILFFIPIVSIIVTAIVSIDIAKSFGQSILFGIGLWLLGFIFYPVLGFGSAQYQGPAAG